MYGLLLIFLLPYAVLGISIEEIITRDDWERLFPNRWHVSPQWRQEYNAQQQWFYPEMNVDYYSYENFIGAVQLARSKGINFLGDGQNVTPEDVRRELSAFLANIAHETGKGDDGLYYREELTYERKTTNWVGLHYQSVGSRWQYKINTSPMMFRSGTQLAGRMRFEQHSYHGRGPLQLSHAYNYGDFSLKMYGDAQVLLNNPDKLLDDPVLGMCSAIWFWMTQPDWRPLYSPHNVIHPSRTPLRPWGFGRTIMAINGGLEANSPEHGGNPAVTRRIKFYRQMAKRLNVTIGVNGEQLDTLGLWN